MRVFHLMIGKGNGGAETYAADMITALQSTGITQQAMLHPAQSRLADIAAAGVTVIPAAQNWPSRWRQQRQARLALAAFQPHIVQCWMRRAASLVPAMDCPVIGWFGGYYQPKHFQRCSHFIGVTPDIVAHQRAHGVAVTHSHFIPTFPTLPATTVPVRRADYATPPTATVVLALSRLHPKKGLDTLLTALATLPAQGADYVLWLAGDGPDAAALRAQAQALGIAERVRFLGWRTDRGALLQAADICVLPSRYEPFGTVMLEAWAAGTPLVAAAAAGPAAFVQDGVNGLLVPIDDAAALAAAFARLRQDAALRQRLSQGGTATYTARFTRAAVVADLHTHYQRLINAGE
jgi:glycosyltransferase involved in cell wall biosynthesis